jgi:WD40 repeat protein
MVFLISPDSIASEVCDWEINHAELKGKRILPVVTREAADVPERLQRLNYVFMRTPDEETASLPRLAGALAVDIDWIRAHTRYGDDAGEWDKAGRPSRLLLRGASIGEAEHWRDTRPATAPQLTETQSAFIAASRRGATARQRGWIAGSLVVAAVAIGLSVYAFLQQQAAETSRKETATVLATSDLRQGTQLVNTADTASDGLAYLARAAEGGDTRAQTRLWTMLQQRSFWLPVESTGTTATGEEIVTPVVPTEVAERFDTMEVDGIAQKVQSIAISGDGQKVFLAVGDVVEATPVKISVWNVDGTPVTDWWEPPYEGDFYLYRVRGYFNHDGRYLAVEMEGWRETATLIVYDMTALKQLDAEIAASGLLPQTQSIGFTDVRFIERPATADREARVLLLTAAAKGDAAIYELSGESFGEIGRNRHRAAVAVAEIDPDSQWLMSAGADRTVTISTLHTFGSVGNLIYADSLPTALRRNGPAGLLVETDNTKWSAYSLKSPVKRKPVPVAPLEGLPNEQEACIRLADPFGEAVSRLEHPSGLILTIEAGRRVGVSRAGGEMKLSPPFAADLHTVCASADGSMVTITTGDFRTEVWTADFSMRRGPAIDERAAFGEGSTPEKTDWVAISPDGKRAMIRSSFWDPPNLEVFWISLWDIESGLPLMDRTEFYDDGLTDGVIRSARFTPDGDITFVGDEALAPSSLELVMPSALPAALPDYAEAIAGQTIDAEGLAVAVANRAERLVEGNKLIESLTD